MRRASSSLPAGSLRTGRADVELERPPGHVRHRRLGQPEPGTALASEVDHAPGPCVVIRFIATRVRRWGVRGHSDPAARQLGDGDDQQLPLRARLRYIAAFRQRPQRSGSSTPRAESAAALQSVSSRLGGPDAARASDRRALGMARFWRRASVPGDPQLL
jgi:hypothetical protein